MLLDKLHSSLSKVSKKYSHTDFNFGGCGYIALFLHENLQKYAIKSDIVVLSCWCDLNDKIAKIWKIAAPRISTIEQLITDFGYCFGEEVKFDAAEIGLNKETLETFLKELESSDFAQIFEITKAFFTAQGLKPKDWYPSLNVIITGKRSCPPVFDVMGIIGKEITKRRIKRAIELL